jgi:hypothetical protein
MGLAFQSRLSLQPCRANRFDLDGAGEGNRTLVVSLEGFCSTIELHPHSPLVEGEGFEPSKAEPADLQSAPFDRSGTPPSKRAILAVLRANGQTSG